MSNNSWKQYGGISQIDNFTTINAGTIIADQFLSRTAKPIDETINGSIYVSGDVVSNFLDIKKSGFINEDLYLNNKLFFFNNDPSFNHYNTILNNNNNHSYLYGNENNIGINTVTPKSVFHIASDNLSLIHI